METISAVNANVILYSFYLLNYHLQGTYINCSIRMHNLAFLNIFD